MWQERHEPGGRSQPGSLGGTDCGTMHPTARQRGANTRQEDSIGTEMETILYGSQALLQCKLWDFVFGYMAQGRIRNSLGSLSSSRLLHSAMESDRGEAGMRSTSQTFPCDHTPSLKWTAPSLFACYFNGNCRNLWDRWTGRQRPCCMDWERLCWKLQVWTYRDSGVSWRGNRRCFPGMGRANMGPQPGMKSDRPGWSLGDLNSRNVMRSQGHWRKQHPSTPTWDLITGWPAQAAGRRLGRGRRTELPRTLFLDNTCLPCRMSLVRPLPASSEKVFLNKCCRPNFH